VVRAQAGDETTPSTATALARDNSLSLRIPCPEDLGIGLGQRPAAAEIDWGTFHSRLNQLGATSFQTTRTREGGYQVTCLLPGRQQGQTHHVEAQAGSEAEAVRLALAQIEEWAASR
jgi:hypothetical protein